MLIISKPVTTFERYAVRELSLLRLLDMNFSAPTYLGLLDNATLSKESHWAISLPPLTTTRTPLAVWPLSLSHEPFGAGPRSVPGVADCGTTLWETLSERKRIRSLGPTL